MTQTPYTSPFDGIRHEDENGKEFWSARELGKLLGYGEYRKFKNAIENADPTKPIVALGQTYFAMQTRRQEINDELPLANLPEDQKRLIFRSLMSTYNIRLAEAASYSYSSGRISTYLRNHSKAFSQ